MTECKEFNATLRSLFDLFQTAAIGIKTSLALTVIREEMTKVMGAQPDYPLQVFGPYIWNRREEISKGDAKHFLDRKYDATIQYLSMTHKIDYQKSLAAVEFMKKAFVAASPQKKEEIVDLVKKLLQQYSVYVRNCKQNK